MMDMETVIEKYLRSLISGEGAAELPEPSCRAEEYLSHCIKGGNVDNLPIPISRLDILLHQLAIKGGSGGSGDDCNHEYATNEEIQNIIDEIFNFSGDGVITDNEIATDEEVKDVIDDIFDIDNDGIATDEEVKAVLESVF